MVFIAVKTFLSLSQIVGSLAEGDEGTYLPKSQRSLVIAPHELRLFLAFHEFIR